MFDSSNNSRFVRVVYRTIHYLKSIKYMLLMQCTSLKYNQKTILFYAIFILYSLHNNLVSSNLCLIHKRYRFSFLLSLEINQFSTQRKREGRNEFLHYIYGLIVALLKKEAKSDSWTFSVRLHRKILKCVWKQGQNSFLDSLHTTPKNFTWANQCCRRVLHSLSRDSLFIAIANSKIVLFVLLDGLSDCAASGFVHHQFMDSPKKPSMLS
jgi:hypothetical protein